MKSISSHRNKTEHYFNFFAAFDFVKPLIWKSTLCNRERALRSCYIEHSDHVHTILDTSVILAIWEKVRNIILAKIIIAKFLNFAIIKIPNPSSEGSVQR